MEEIMKLRIWKYACQRKRFYALGGIEEVEVFLHRHGFAGNYSYAELEERLGNRIRVEGRRSQNYRSNSYRNTGYIWFNGERLRLFWGRRYPSLRESIIEISTPSQEFLAQLNEALPNLDLDLVEYPVDLYCADSSAVRELFTELVRYLYARNAGRPGCHMGHSSENIQSPALNWTYHARRLKVYERGPDDNKINHGWLVSQVDRVRVELRADKKFLSKNGMRTLEDLLRNCNFEKVFMRHFEFKIFEGSTILPTENRSYCRVRGLESFQQELWLAHRRGSPQNPNQYVVDAPGFDKLKKRVVRKIRKFDRDWRDNYQIIFSNRIIRAVRRRVHS